MANDLDGRREGDERPFLHDQEKSLTFLPAQHQPFRWLPRHGQPSCVGEWLSQGFVRTLAWWPVYTGVVATLILVLQLWHPFGLGE